jgi:antitoxin component YwqK of YwqJK toxin-antitoxin module
LQAQNSAYYDAKFKELPDSTGAVYTGVLNGNIETIWHITGEKYLEYTYKLEGDILIYDTYTKYKYFKNGNISEKYNVVNGMYNGSFITYYEDGKVHISGNYKNDEFDGLITVYTEDGYSNHYMYKNGKEEKIKVKLLSSLYLSKADIKKYSKFAEKIGLIKYEVLKDKSKKDFWDYVQKNNTRLNKFLEACKKETKMAKTQ